MKTVATFPCPEHGKPAIWVDKFHYKCPKCFTPNYVPADCKPTEYFACRAIENPYRHMYDGYYFGGAFSIFHSLNEYLSKVFKYKLPKLTLPTGRESAEKFSGLYMGRNGKLNERRGTITLQHYAGIVTLVHEYTHHIAFVDKLKVNDEHANHHGADFLVVLKMLLEELPIFFRSFNNV